MKFIVSTSTLLHALQKVSGVIVSKPVIPIIETFLFDINQGELTITATDLETSMTTKIKVEADENLNIAIPAKKPMDILRSLPDQPVTFSVDIGSLTVEINWGAGNFKLAGQPGSDFPRIERIETDKSFTIKSETLLSAISRTVFATGNDELRLNLTGIFVEMFEDHISFVATDANRLVKFSRKDVKPGFEHAFILPKKASGLLKSTLADSEDEVHIDFNNSNAFFKYGDSSLTCRFIEDRYPDYNAVIPKENPNLLQINRIDFLNAVRRVGIVANKTTNQIRLKIAGSELTVSAEDFDMSNEGYEKLLCEYTGADIEIGFNGKFLLDLLTAMPTDYIKFELSTPNRAGVLFPQENEPNEEVLMLVMPMMLNNY